jgi:hypothetical protein
MAADPVRNAAKALTFLIPICAAGPAPAAGDYWQEKSCARSVPEPALMKKAVRGHTFKIVKRRGEALETATVAGERVTIIHFGCEGVGWQIRTRLSDEDMRSGAPGIYQRARKLLTALAPSARKEPKLAEAIAAIDNYVSRKAATPALSERLLAVPGDVATTVSVSTAGEGSQTWLTVMIYTGPI